jgi:hypothetical protein
VSASLRINQFLFQTSQTFPLTTHRPQFVFTMTLGSKSATSHFSLPNRFSPGVTAHSNSPATPETCSRERISLLTCAGENYVANIAHLVARSAVTNWVPTQEAICKPGLPSSSETNAGEGKPNLKEKRKNTSV